MDFSRSAASRSARNDEMKNRIISAIWGVPNDTGSLYKLDSYFENYKREMRHAAALVLRQAEQHDSVIYSFNTIKSNIDKPKRGLEKLQQNSPVVDLGLRLMFMTPCQTPGMIGGDIFRPRRKADESLGQYIERVYSQCASPSEDVRNQPVFLSKLNADLLRRHANAEIRWTDHLTDHLPLLKGSDWKSLYIFANPAFILRSLETLVAKGSDADQAYESPLAL